MKRITLLLLSFCFCSLVNTVAASAQSAEATAQEYAAFNVSVVGKGKPIILIPGVSSSPAVWQDTIDYLSDRYQIHALSLAGFAGVKPVAPQMVGASYLQFQKNAIVNYIRKNNLNDVVIIGHSLGGTLALWLASEQHAEIASVINIDGLPALGALYGSQGETSSESPRSFDPKSMVKSMANNEAWHDQMLSDMMTSDPMTSGRAFGELMQLDLRDELKNIERPVLTIGAPAQAAPYASFEDTKENYETQMANVPTQFKHMVYAKSAKHFIMVDEPEWIMKQITTFIKSTK